MELIMADVVSFCLLSHLLILFERQWCDIAVRGRGLRAFVGHEQSLCVWCFLSVHASLSFRASNVILQKINSP